jgi:hypothetical protein
MALELETIKSLSQFANLKAYYRFEDDALTTDSSGEGHTLTAIGDPAEDASGKFGGAVALDGNDAYSATDHADFKPTGDFTIGVWVKTSTSANQFIFQSFSQNTKQAGIRLFVYSSSGYKIRFDSSKNTGTTVGTDYQQVISTTNVNDGNWHFAVGTWDGTYLKLYIDGTQECGNVGWANAPVYAATNYVRVGCQNNTGTDATFFTGSLDDVFLLNGTALSAAQIKAIYEGWILTASAGSFTLTGVASVITVGYNLIAGVGSFVLTGVNATLSKGITLVAGLGEFALTGYDAVLSSAYTLVASLGEFTLTGVNAALQKAITLVAGAGSFILTGKDVILRQALNLVASLGEFTLTGYDSILKRTYTLVAETGSFILTGFSATFKRCYTLAAEAGSFILTGVDATFRRGINLIAETGVFSVTMKTVSFLFDGLTYFWSKRTKPTTAYSNRTKPTTNWTNRTKIT